MPPEPWRPSPQAEDSVVTLGRYRRTFSTFALGALTTSREAKLTYAFTSRSFTRVIGQWEGLDLSEAGGTDDTVFSGSVLYGYRLNWRSILYVGYGNEAALKTDLDRQQVLFVKMAYAFRH
jgi:hypothetical protein